MDRVKQNSILLDVLALLMRTTLLQDIVGLWVRRAVYLIYIILCMRSWISPSMWIGFIYARRRCTHIRKTFNSARPSGLFSVFDWPGQVGAPEHIALPGAVWGAWGVWDAACGAWCWQATESWNVQFLKIENYVIRLKNIDCCGIYMENTMWPQKRHDYVPFINNCFAYQWCPTTQHNPPSLRP